VSTQTFAQLSNGFVYGSIGVLSLAMFAFAAELAFGTRSRVARTNEAALVATRQPVSVGVSGAADAASVAGRAPQAAAAGATAGASNGDGGAVDGDIDVDAARQRRADRLGGIAASLTVLATGLLFLGVLCRGFAARRAPWGNMYEFSTASALVVLVVFIAVARRRPALRYLGVFVVVPVLLSLGLALTVLYVPAGPLLPALKSYWLVIHVAAAIISGGVFTVGGVVTALYLVQERWERTGVVNSLSRRLPTAEQLDQSAYRLFAFVFPLWTFAIVAGAIWAENAWGTYWSWDPKETWALVTWVVFAGYLHARATAGWKGRKAAIVALVGMSCFIFNYFGVNIFFTGLHAYGGLPNK
jgi:cytochrome c-type biogenesis protein CcsB